MKIVSTEKFFTPPTSIDMLIQTEITNKNIPEEHTVGINVDFIDTNVNTNLKYPSPNDDYHIPSTTSNFKYSIKYSSLLDSILKCLIQLVNLAENQNYKNELIKKVFNLQSSIFYQPVFRGCSSVTRLEVYANDTMLFEYNNYSCNDEIPLGFNFWCHTPAVFSFTRINLYTLFHLTSVDFNTKILYLDKSIFKNVACEYNIAKTIDNKNILVGSGAYSIVDDDNIKNYSTEISHTFHYPYVQHPNRVKFRVWGIDVAVIRDVVRKYPQFISEVTNSITGDMYSISIGGKIPWIEFLMRDNNVEEALYNDPSVLYFYRIDIEYTPSQIVINNYTNIANKIAKDKYLWKLKLSGNISSEKEQVKSIKYIESEAHKANVSLRNDINELLILEKRYNKSNFVNDHNAMVKVIFRVEVNKITSLTIPPIYYVIIFYTNKSVEYIEMRVPDILRNFANILDEESFHELEKSNC